MIKVPFIEAFHVAMRWKIMPSTPYQNSNKINAIKTPILPLHNKANRVIPIEHSQKFYMQNPADISYHRGRLSTVIFPFSALFKLGIKDSATCFQRIIKPNQRDQQHWRGTRSARYWATTCCTN